MTTPVQLDEIVSGARQWLAAKPAVLAVLGTFPGTTEPYLFQHKLWAKVERSESTLVVLYRAGGFTTANLHNTMRFPRLGVDINVDPIRDQMGNVADPGEVYRRAEQAYRVLDKHLHRPQGGEQMWGTVRTIACTRVMEPTYYGSNDGSGPIRLQVFYAVSEG